MFNKVLVLLLQISCIFCNILSDAKLEQEISLNADPVIVDDVAFVKLGTYRGFADDGAEYQKSYFVSRYLTAFWGESRAICKSYNMELVTLDTLNEARAFLTLADNCKHFVGEESVNIDGTCLTPKSTTDWYWTRNGAKIAYAIPWYPGQPNNGGGNQFCLSIYRESSAKSFGFNDFMCAAAFPFACQRYELYIPKVNGI